ncbi:MAG TPA: 2-oxo-4-hydroxy-4-carboxy-5-ureidoimidazoline decarboxylase [Thermoanaerobaculia bacterium]|nr:2-oxo-4-hydroxy-4-carboxy-5-ureidoimidazoline decarboxylase [Thermoanaerobaculia bacterium]
MRAAGAPIPPGLVRFNALAAEEALAELLSCCASSAWAQAVAACRPFADAEALYAAAERIWWGLRPEDWHAAFAAHPRIGERPAGGPHAGRSPQVVRSVAWSAAEQAGGRAASAPLLDELAAANRGYEARFGWVFLICAAGKSAKEMLAALRARIGNDPQAELRVAAAEQAKITRLRLARLLDETSGVEPRAVTPGDERAGRMGR